MNKFQEAEKRANSHPFMFKLIVVMGVVGLVIGPGVAINSGLPGLVGLIPSVVCIVVAAVIRFRVRGGE